MLARFAWDTNKDAANQRKHHVSFSEASEVFLDTFSATTVDHRHDAGEQRYFTIGLTKSGQLLAVGHTDDELEIRIITARAATLTERRQYEDG